MIEQPKLAQKSQPVIQIQPKSLPPPPAKEESRAVFGLNKNTLQDNSDSPSSDGVEIKKGNTLAIAPDDKILNEDDVDSLPIPADEYLVTEMPKLLEDIRVPYPKSAREKGIEGPVVFDLLIDNEGRVREVSVLEGPGGGLNEAATEAVNRLRFKPAKIETKAVAVRIRYTYRFVLEK